MSYAATTTVSVQRSKAEIEGLVERYGASKFASMWDKDIAAIQFEYDERVIRFTLRMPDFEAFRYTPARNNRRDDAATRAGWEQGCRARWRALFLCVKAKLETVNSEIATFEEEFFAHIVIPGLGQTMYEHLGPQLGQLTQDNGTPLMLPGVKT